MMENIQNEHVLAPLECELNGRFHSRYKQIGFPSPELIRVKSRTISSAGRLTQFVHDGLVQRTDGQFGLGRFSQFDMDGLEAGASFWVEVEHGKIRHLEIIINGDHEWDGSESVWTVRDPDTGELSDRE